MEMLMLILAVVAILLGAAIIFKIVKGIFKIISLLVGIVLIALIIGGILMLGNFEGMLDDKSHPEPDKPLNGTDAVNVSDNENSSQSLIKKAGQLPGYNKTKEILSRITGLVVAR